MTPSADDLHIAAMWLDVYEGAEDAQACKRVAEWLMKKADQLELKQICREAGVKTSTLRRAVRQMEKKQQ